MYKTLPVLITMIKCNRENPSNREIIEYWDNNQNKINYPVTLADKNEYKMNWASVNCGDKLSVPSIAHELFMLETFNRAYVKDALLNGAAAVGP